MLSIHEFDITIIEAGQEIGDWIRPVAEVFSALGTTITYCVVIMVVYWCFNSRLGLKLALMLPLNGALNDILKLAFHEPRPFCIDTRVEAHHLNRGFGFPSGHAESSVGFWGLVAYKTKWRSFAIIVPFLVLFVGFSRIYFGVHSPTQVLTGLVIGGVVLYLFVKYEKTAIAIFTEMKFGWQIVCSQAIPASFILIGYAIVESLGNWDAPSQWYENFNIATNESLELPLNIKGLVEIGGALSGILLGAILLLKEGMINVGGLWWKRVGRVIVGTLGVVSILIVRTTLLDQVIQSDVAGYLIRYIITALASAWVIGLSPMLFVKMRLADPTKA